MQEIENLPLKLNMKQWKSIIHFLPSYKKTIMLLLFCSVFTSFIQALYPVLTGYAISNFVEPKTTEGMMGFAVGFTIIAFIQCIGTVYYSKSAMKTEIGVEKDIRFHLFNHVQELSIEYFNNTPVGAIMARIMSDTEKMGMVFSWHMAALTYNIFYVCFAIINMLLLNVRLSIGVAMVVPVMYVCVNYFQMKMLKQNRKVRERNSEVTASYNENIMGLGTVKELNIKDKVVGEFRDKNHCLKEEGLKYKGLESIFYPLIMCFNGVIVAIILGFGSSLVFAQQLQVGELAVFVSYAFLMINPIEQTIKSVSFVISAQANVERINELFATAPLVQDAADVMQKYGSIYEAKTENWEELKGDIEFKDVSFRYPDSEIYVLEHFNLTIKAGTTVAIVGHTGAGKSTLVNLVCRFFEPTSGEILIDGVDYRKRSLLWLQHNLSYVLQAPHLFSGTIEENIRYAKADATMEEVIESAKKAQAHTFIKKLPKGYQTEVGQGGDKLSTGQKQLVSIARAILADGKIFVMDEATSSVDTHTEQLINSMTFNLMENRTSFIIAHRLSTVKNADIILVVENGKIIEQGNHRQLLKKQGHYYELYTGQWEEQEQEAFFDQLHGENSILVRVL
ncbi:MAG: ABC transporter ATP-binding protein [Eubacteriales bacterium]